VDLSRGVPTHNRAGSLNINLKTGGLMIEPLMKEEREESLFGVVIIVAILFIVLAILGL